ncbi:hypothetical protein COR50_15320 [Chitinophaga caeni]|uniref:Uncharacterized protein n=1 Tax=Chitinophaga caeni TaxID=2029983 RepID=A0A291QWW2_9BACT|nr:hypothetical protein [Chitinophaga caeni]ATL48420.1 hypothetical protein COR50_15320 [Chitinophaga caeni]
MKICITLIAIVSLLSFTACHRHDMQTPIKRTFVLSDVMLDALTFDTVKQNNVVLPSQSDVLQQAGALDTNYIASILDRAMQRMEVIIPRNVVVENEHHYYVLVFKDRYNISSREIHIDQAPGKDLYLVGGLKPGELLVSSHQQLIFQALNESSD